MLYVCAIRTNYNVQCTMLNARNNRTRSRSISKDNNGNGDNNDVDHTFIIIVLIRFCCCFWFEYYTCQYTNKIHKHLLRFWLYVYDVFCMCVCVFARQCIMMKISIKRVKWIWQLLWHGEMVHTFTETGYAIFIFYSFIHFLMRSLALLLICTWFL